ncbi:2-methylisocitrate lyase-like PEP mutase family enzyme [Pseudoduganella flava]|uniref:2-methylisocitrate lyase-like PEP mutase family enzyme n=1 Tax=Pseudoduganella flava TaxID=871742 RepID=A0A562PJ07_9BURK|nr:isocitrate lyase/phosphoenolpyruvate mutase family protein [Pseudoduganella flava]QGZ41995.1 isocitrate lyase/phosphoenolpyruvate mutase family protein [Pseudoduganella flava]TWI44407.1 2-methylisocitrate lyase-like PEP mutase family enzyme [Pseudoduganella flava]
MKKDDLFQALHEDGLLLLANCWDGGSARLAQAAGAQALATSSAAVAWSHGHADGSHLPVELLLATARGIGRVSDLPLTVDIEDGYSDDPAQVAALVRELIGVGVVGINIEDGGGPVELLCRKIAAVRAAAAGTRLYINARTDVYLRGLAPAGERVSETIRRAALYRDAGASGLFVPGVSDEADIGALAGAIGMPLNVMALPQLPAPARLRELGVRRLSAGSATGEAAYAAAHEAIVAFLGSGAVAARSLGYGAINALMVA